MCLVRQTFWKAISCIKNTALFSIELFKKMYRKILVVFLSCQKGKPHPPRTLRKGFNFYKLNGYES